jgi:hypothetical protein
MINIGQEKFCGVTTWRLFYFLYLPYFLNFLKLIP